MRFLVGTRAFFDGDDESFVPADVGLPLGVGLGLLQSALALERDESGFLDVVTKLTIQRTTQTPNTPTIQATTVADLAICDCGFFWGGVLGPAADAKFENGSRSDVAGLSTITAEG